MVFLVYFFIILYDPVEESYFLILFVFFPDFVKVCSVPFLGCVWFSGLAEDQCGDIPYHG